MNAVRSFCSLTIRVVLVLILTDTAWAQFDTPPRSLGHGSVEWSRLTPDEATLVIAGSAGIQLFDAATLDDVAHLVREVSGDYRHRAFAFSPDSRYLAIPYRDTTVVVWDLRSRSLTAALPGHTNWITAITFSDDGSRLATGDQDGGMRVWSTQSWDLLAERNNEHVRAILFRGVDTLITSNGYRSIRLWSLPDFSRLGDFAHEDNVGGLKLLPDGNRLLSTADDGTARLWDLETNEALAVLPHGGVYTSGLLISPDGQHVLFSGSSSSFQATDVWRLDPLEKVATFGYPDAGILGFTADGRHVLVWHVPDDADHLLRFWDLEERRFTHAIDAPLGGYTSLGPETMRITSVSTGSGMESLDLNAAWRHHRHILFMQHVDDLAFSPGGELLFVASSRDLHIWSTGDGRLLRSVQTEEQSIDDMAFTNDCNWLYTKGDATLMRRDVADPTSFHVVLQGPMQKSAFAPSVLRVALSGREGEISIHRLLTGSEELRLQGPGDRLRDIALSANATWLAASGAFQGPAARIWHVPDGQLLTTFAGSDGARRLEFSPDEKLLVGTGHHDGLTLWDLESLSVRDSIVAGYVDDVGYAPDGRHLVWGEFGQYPLQFYNVESGARSAAHGTLPPVSPNVVEFSRGGSMIAVGGYRGRLLLWKAEDVNETQSSPCRDFAFEQPVISGPVEIFTYSVADTVVTEPVDTIAVTIAAVRLDLTWPNPAPGSATISFALPTATDVRLELHDLAGQPMRLLARGGYDAGEHVVPWDGRNEAGDPVASGVYLVVLRAGGSVRLGKLVLLR
jgi:WD40 repeat protein